MKEGEGVSRAFIWSKRIPGWGGRLLGIRNMTGAASVATAVIQGTEYQKEARSQGALGATVSSLSFTSSEVETSGGF